MIKTLFLLGSCLGAWMQIIGLMLSLSLPAFFFAQQNRPVKFERISLEQGISQSSVLCILQDRQGFMWFGTQEGVNKLRRPNERDDKH